jgi:hydroxypyruvate isomerase
MVPSSGMQRRQFVASLLLGGLGVAGVTARGADQKGPFMLGYAPHFGMFKHSAPGGLINELEFAHEQGFRCWEDNGMVNRSLEEQKAVSSCMEKLGMKMGVISAKTGIQSLNFASRDRAARDLVLQQVRDSVEVAKRVNAGFMTLVSGQADPRWPREIQLANCIDLLRRASEIVEPHNITMVMEPLNRFRNHPGSFIQTVTEGYLVCRAVDHPNCKVLYDLYHQQIAGGNLIPLFDLCRDQIAYLQVGDNPGRKEPGTGEINYAKVFRHLLDSGYKGIIGMEHGNAGEGMDGERSVIAAYRRLDPAGA